MSEPFLAEIKIVGFNFAPRSWALCDGQILPINQNQSLYALLGTIYGGDGRTSFALPDLRSRTPIHVGAVTAGANHPLGQKTGEETHVLNANEMPAHDHALRASSDDADTPIPAGNVFAKAPATDPRYAAGDAPVSLHASAVGTVGGQAHDNMQPFLALNFAIALQGFFPPRNSPPAESQSVAATPSQAEGEAEDSMEIEVIHRQRLRYRPGNNPRISNFYRHEAGQRGGNQDRGAGGRQEDRSGREGADERGGSGPQGRTGAKRRRRPPR